jgi:hypothetical protein
MSYQRDIERYLAGAQMHRRWSTPVERVQAAQAAQTVRDIQHSAIILRTGFDALQELHVVAQVKVQQTPSLAYDAARLLALGYLVVEHNVAKHGFR